MTAYLELCRGILYWMLVAPFRGRAFRAGHVFQQMVRVGVRGVPMAALTASTIGLVLAMQGAVLLEKMGADVYVPDLVAAALLKELAPLVVAIIIIGRSGAGITAELGTMRVSEEIEALDVMAISPIAYLVVPRFLALVIMAPVLTVFGIYSGLFGGWAVGSISLHQGTSFFIQRALDAVELKDLMVGLVKSVVFGSLIGSIACFYGMNVEGGAAGVGKSTTASVVVSLLAIFIANAILTALFFMTE